MMILKYIILCLFRVNFKGDNIDIEFSIKESFGPFNCDNLLLMTSCKRGRVLLIIEKFNIYGISSEGGEVLFDIPIEGGFDIKSFIQVIEGCLLCIDSKGNMRLIEIFYETGQVLATWHFNFSERNHNWTLEQVTATAAATAAIHKLSGKFNLIIKIRCEMIGKVILIYSIDPLSEIVTCTFRHWIMNSCKDSKDMNSCKDSSKDINNLPFIV